jgi:hypothetical protein
MGGGQSTALLASLGQQLGWGIITIDMNPESIAQKLRSHSLSQRTLDNIAFRKGISLRTQQIHSFYDRKISTVGGVSFSDAVKAAATFIDVSMDIRKAPMVSAALDLPDFNSDLVLDAITQADGLTERLIQVFRTPGDEFEFHLAGSEPQMGCLEEILDGEIINAVFLDSGEFSSLPEWEIVHQRLRSGSYVILHDIFFPKSFKNWLVCGAIMADPAYEVLYIDRSTPQGLMVAQKKI